MAKKEVIWSLRAHQDRLWILEYWIDRNKSKVYSEKLYELFNSAIDIISVYPEIGKPTNKPRVRAKIVRHYLIVYEVQSEFVDILTIRESQQDPKKLKKMIEKISW